MRQWIGLFVVAPGIFLGDVTVVAQTNKSEKIEEGTAGQKNTGLHLLNASPTELRRFLQRYSPNRLTKNCKKEVRGDSRLGWLYPIPGGAWFIVGRSDNSETKLEKIERMYHVERFSKAGAPLKGQMHIKLKSDIARKKRACLEILQGMPIIWIVQRNEFGDAGETFKMFVQKVRFSREARVNTGGDTIPTGEIVASLMLSESWWSMAYRKSAEQIWGAALGFVASVFLMVLIGIVPNLVKNRRRLRKHLVWLKTRVALRGGKRTKV